MQVKLSNAEIQTAIKDYVSKTVTKSTKSIEFEIVDNVILGAVVELDLTPPKYNLYDR